MDGMVITRYITANMYRIMRIMTGVITEIITRIIIGHSRHVERAIRKSSTVTITMTTTGGTFGSGNPGSETMVNINVLWPGFPPP